jgi:hypothetical protein
MIIMKNIFLISISCLFCAFASCQNFDNPPPGNPNPNYTEEGPSMEFVHPGILHTTASLTRMKNFVLGNVSPAIDCYRLMQENPLSSSTYVMQGPFTIIARDGANASTKRPSEDDHEAAYLNSLMWYITGNEAHALKTIEIMNAYAGTLREIGPDSNDDPLCASLQGFLLANAAEIIKHTYEQVSDADVKSWEGMFNNVFIPVLREFFAKPAYTNGNWGAAAIKAFMAFGVFMDNESLYNEAVDFFYNGEDNGSLTNYIAESGQCQESGRDQNHTMLGLGQLAEACEIAYNQNNETLYSASSNRLLTGYEYTAKYNLGYNDVPFVTWQDVTGRYSNWTSISTADRGRFRPIFEIVYNHYVTRKGLEMPYTRQIISEISPEGDAQWCDHPGYGTLLFRTETGMPPSEGAVEGKGTDWSVVTANATGVASGDDYIVTPAPAGEKFRGDVRRGKLSLHIGNYPILAVVVQGLPATRAFTFDSSEFGYYKNSRGTQWGQNTAYIVEKDYGTVYYWDFSEGNFFKSENVQLPANQSFDITITLKIADLVYPEAMTPYTIKWMKSFRNVQELNTYLEEN